MWILPIFTVIGGVVCVISGVGVVVLAISLVTDWAWKRCQHANAMIEIQRAIKAYKASQKEAD